MVKSCLVRCGAVEYGLEFCGTVWCGLFGCSVVLWGKVRFGDLRSSMVESG